MPPGGVGASASPSGGVGASGSTPGILACPPGAAAETPRRAGGSHPAAPVAPDAGGASTAAPTGPVASGAVAEPIDTAEYTARMRAMWGEGDYSGLAGRLAPAAAELVESVAPEPGARVLDLAAGTGNVAILAAARGARVVAADLSPRMVELGRARTAGLPVEWLEADAEQLPLPDGSVDATLSAFGVIYAPRPEVALAEARRVLAPGGTFAFTVWQPDGFVGEMTTLMQRRLPVPPGVADVLDWGREAVVAGWLAKAGLGGVTFRPVALPWEFDSPAAMTRFFLDHDPTHRAARAALGAGAGEMFGAVERLAGPPDEPVRVEAGYAVITATAG